MDKRIVSALMVIVIVVGAGLGVMMYTDKQIDQMLDRVEQTNNPEVSVALSTDENSLTSRELSHFIRLDNGEVYVDFIVNSSVKKRPWGATIEQEVLLDQDFVSSIDDLQVQQFLQTYLVEQPFLTGTTEVGLTGNILVDAQSIAINEDVDGFMIALEPLVFQINGNLRGGEVDSSGAWNGLVLELEDVESVRAEFKPVEFASNGRFLSSSLFIGEQTINGQGLSILVTGPESLDFNMGGFSSVASANIVDNLIDADFSFSLSEMTFDSNDSQINLTDFSIQTLFEGADVDNLNRFVEAANALEQSAIVSEAVAREGSLLLQNGFVFEVVKLGGLINDAPFSADARLQLPQNDIADINNPFSLMGLIPLVSAEANLALAGELVDIPEIAQGVGPLMSAGVLVANGEDYALTFEMGNGEVRLNGNPVPLPF